MAKKTEKLAVDGGPKAVPTLGPHPTKLGIEELMELISLWDVSDENKARILEILKGQERLDGPHLFRYYNPKASKVEAAEKLIREKVGTQHALAVNSCTSALVASLRALGIGAGDEVVVPAYTFFSSASAVAACNAVPVLCEVDDSLNIDPIEAEKLITKRTKAILPVHMRGVPAQMDAILDLADRKGLPVVEDVAQAIGASFNGKQCGSLGTMGCFSFDFIKIVASGEGGFITTNDKWLYTRAQSWHDTAACWRPDRYGKEIKEGELFCGENYRMSELQGAVAVAQIRKLDDLISSCRSNKKRIREGLENLAKLSLRRLPDADGDIGICLVFFLPDTATAKDIAIALQAEGVPAIRLYDPEVRNWHIYTYWQHILEKKSVAADGLPWSAIPNAELPTYSEDMCPRTLDILSRSIHINIDPNYTREECDAIAKGINKVLCAKL